MKKGILLILCAALILSLWGCGTDQTEQAAHAQCEKFLTALQQGDWETVRQNLPLDGLGSGIPTGDDDNLLTGMLRTMKYQITQVQKGADGTLTVILQIENVDMKALLESLSADVSSREEARQQMLQKLPTAKRRTFQAFLTLSAVEGQEEWDIVIDVSFANAVSGGMYDLLEDLAGGVK